MHYEYSRLANSIISVLCKNNDVVRVTKYSFCKQILFHDKCCIMFLAVSCVLLLVVQILTKKAGGIFQFMHFFHNDIFA